MVDIVSIGLSVDSRPVKEGTAALNDLGKQSGETSSATDKLKSSYASMAMQVAGATAVLAGTIAVIKSSVQAADDYNKALTGLASIARYAGQDVGLTLNTALSLTEDGLMSTTEAATALKNLLAKGFSTDEAVQMIGRLKDAAAFGRQSTLGLSEAVVGATEGIKNENSMLIDNAGVTKNAAVMIDEYAKSLGKSSKELNEAEKRTALFNGIMKETEGQMGNAALASDGLTGKQSALSKAVNEIAISIGQAFMPAAIALVDILGTSMRWLNESVIKPVIFGMQSLGITIGEIVMKATALFDLLASPGELLKNPQEAIKKYQQEIKTLGYVTDQMRMDAAMALNTVATPNIGSDSGARRQDVVVVDTKEEQRAIEKSKKLEERQALETQKLIDAQNDRYQRLEEAALDADATAEEREVMKRDRAMMALAEQYDAIQQNHIMTVEEEQNFQNAILNIQKASDAQKTAMGKAAFIQDLATLGKQNSAFMLIYKAAAVMEILAAGATRAERSAAWAAMWGGLPAAAAAQAISWAATLANVGMVTGLLGGGGGGGAGSGVSSAGSSGGGTPTFPFQPEPIQTMEATKPTRELRVTVESDGPHSQGMREFAKNLAETIRDMGGTDNLVIS